MGFPLVCMRTVAMAAPTHVPQFRGARVLERAREPGSFVALTGRGDDFRAVPGCCVLQNLSLSPTCRSAQV